MTTEVTVVIGAGSMGQAIARRIGVGQTILLADINEDNAKATATALTGAGYRTSTAKVDVSSQVSVRELADAAARLGAVTHVVHTAGLSPGQASPEAIIAVDLVGTAHVLDEFARVIAPGGSGIVISSQAGYMIPPLPHEQNEALARTPAGELAALPFLQPDTIVNSGIAYAVAKRANTLRTQAAAVTWGDRGARVNSLSPGIIMTPLALDELNSPAGALYQEMIKASASGRVGTPDEIGTVAAFLMGRDGSFITGSDLLIDGGVIASIAAGRFQVRVGG
ncbi:short-chain dehydrogenase [Actinoplanes cyaneus]|uniref:Short-chain dehydrogenase n=1 Tax=Actinoplanes cyaneus TaxID=52696 RepID=A0A919M2I1_9ACTN|nr:SDR family oxidoreductase [Actinoplanes cyaneus]MCW2141214.1 NAD(P)-dependent dehydrogenase, short-chain alcohol dehydrogenase family [Actinoplanes cyaneus]GID67280.1 short-chain dehydrogenase [Actinoplanes cyaneus]